MVERIAHQMVGGGFDTRCGKTLPEITKIKNEYKKKINNKIIIIIINFISLNAKNQKLIVN